MDHPDHLHHRPARRSGRVQGHLLKDEFTAFGIRQMTRAMIE
jgi:hypothetical protein